MNLFDRWRSALEALRGQGRLRTLQAPRGVDFTSNDYLGYAAEPTSAAEPRLSRGGAASRLLRGHHPIWEEVESELARWHGAEAALVMSSGYMANQGLLAAVIDKNDCVLSDEFNHASIIDGLKLNRPERLIYAHCNPRDILRIFGSTGRPSAGSAKAVFVVTESLFSMDGDKAPLTEIVEIAERHGAHVIVDEAHATGCFGPDGAGLVDALGLRPRVLATVHTGGKALGVPGAYICCSTLLKDYLINRCRHLIYTTALPPLVGAWWLQAVERVRKDASGRQRLHANARLFRDALEAHGIKADGEHYIVPVVLGADVKAVRAAAVLHQAGFDIRAIRPPTVPEGTARLRISIHADHEAAMLRRAAAALAEAAS